MKWTLFGPTGTLNKQLLYVVYFFDNGYDSLVIRIFMMRGKGDIFVHRIESSPRL